MTPRRKQTPRGAKSSKKQPARTRPSKAQLRPTPSWVQRRIARSKPLPNTKASKKARPGIARAESNFDESSATSQRSDSTPSVIGRYDGMRRPQLWKLLKARKMKCLAKNQDCIESLLADDAEKAADAEDADDANEPPNKRSVSDPAAPSQPASESPDPLKKKAFLPPLQLRNKLYPNRRTRCGRDFTG